MNEGLGELRVSQTLFYGAFGRDRNLLCGCGPLLETAFPCGADQDHGLTRGGGFRYEAAALLTAGI